MTERTPPAAVGPGPSHWPRRFVASGATPDPRESHQQLVRLDRQVWVVVRLLAASCLDVGRYEVKLVIGEALHTLVEVAASCEERIGELRSPIAARDRAGDAVLEARLAAALSSAPERRLEVLYHDWLAPLVDAFGQARFDPLLDGPSERVRRRAEWDLRDAVGWFASTATEAPEQDGASDAAPTAPVRPTMGVRDERFRTFENTRDYRQAADWTSAGSAYADDLLELARVNRDELDALETFALALFDLAVEAPLDVLRHLARLAWDEARHSACGHAVIAERFGDPFRYACSMIGIRVRGSMTGWDAWTQITLFGELGIITPMRNLAREARQRADSFPASVFAFICADEAMHLRASRDLLREHHPAGSLAAAAAAARAHAADTLDRLGLCHAEKFAALDEREIFELLGE